MRLKEDPDFHDIERVGHTDLRGPRSSVSLKAVLSELDIRTSQGFDEVIDSEHPLVNYSEGFIARYFHHAGYLAAEAVRSGRCPFECFVLQSHAEGVSQREIANDLEELHSVYWTRKKVRTIVEAFSLQVRSLVDNEVS